MIVVDASVAAKWLFPEDGSEKAIQLLRDCAQPRARPRAPHLLLAEITNVVRKRVGRTALPMAFAEEALERFFSVGVELAPSASSEHWGMHLRSLQIAVEFGLQATYDATYIALAEASGFTLWTADQRLLRSLDGKLPFVRALSEYP